MALTAKFIAANATASASLASKRANKNTFGFEGIFVLVEGIGYRGKGWIVTIFFKIIELPTLSPNPCPLDLFFLRFGSSFNESNRFSFADFGRVNLTLSLPHIAAFFSHSHIFKSQFMTTDNNLQLSCLFE
jgi:hypothetical protein